MQKQFRDAARNGHLNVCQSIIQHLPKPQWHECCPVVYNHFHILKWMLDKVSLRFQRAMFHRAISRNNLLFAQYIHDHVTMTDTVRWQLKHSDPETLQWVLDTLKPNKPNFLLCALEQNPNLDWILSQHIELPQKWFNPNIYCNPQWLIFARQQHVRIDPTRVENLSTLRLVDITPQVMRSVLLRGDHAMIRYCLRYCELPSDALQLVARSGQFHVLRHLHRKCPHLSLEKVCVEALFYNDMDMLEYAKEHGCC